MRLEITQTEQALLLEMLDEAVRDLKAEISNTDSPFFRETLKAREQTLLGLLGKLRQAEG